MIKINFSINQNNNIKNITSFFNFFSALLQIRSPSIQLKRFRGKINIQRPREPHYERAKVIAVTNPIFKEPQVYKKTYTVNQKSKDIENPYEKIIAKDVLNWFNHSQLVAIFHLNSISAEDLFKVRVALHKQNMQFKAYGKRVMNLAIKDTKYENVLPLFDAKNCIVFSTEQKLKLLMKITKKVPQMILLAGIVENRIMSRSEITQFAAMPDLTTVRAQFVGVLNSIGGGLVNNLECHQKQLVNILETHAKLNLGEKLEEKKDEVEETK